MTLDSVTSFLKEIRWWLVGAFALAVIFGLWKPSCPKAPEIAPPSVPVEQKPALPRTDAPEPQSEQAGKIHVKVKVPVCTDTVKARYVEFDLYPNLNAERPPLVFNSDSTAQVEVVYTPYRDSRIALEVGFMLGVDVNEHLEPSPCATVTVLRAWDFRLGGMIDKFGAGPALSLNFWREWELTAKWNLWEWHSQPTKWSIGVQYRF